MFPSPSATPHQAHILNTALIYVQTDDTEHLRRQITIELFFGKQRRFILQLRNSRNVKWKGDLNEELYSVCKKLSFIGNLLGTFWRSLLKTGQNCLE